MRVAWRAARADLWPLLVTMLVVALTVGAHRRGAPAAHRPGGHGRPGGRRAGRSARRPDRHHHLRRRRVGPDGRSPRTPRRASTTRRAGSTAALPPSLRRVLGPPVAAATSTDLGLSTPELPTGGVLWMSYLWAGHEPAVRWLAGVAPGRPGPDGAVQLALSDEVARALGVGAGDTFDGRQARPLDGAGAGHRRVRRAGPARPRVAGAAGGAPAAGGRVEQTRRRPWWVGCCPRPSLPAARAALEPDGVTRTFRFPVDPQALDYGELRRARHADRRARGVAGPAERPRARAEGDVPARPQLLPQARERVAATWSQADRGARRAGVRRRAGDPGRGRAARAPTVGGAAHRARPRRHPRRHRRASRCRVGRGRRPGRRGGPDARRRRGTRRGDVALGRGRGGRGRARAARVRDADRGAERGSPRPDRPAPAPPRAARAHGAASVVRGCAGRARGRGAGHPAPARRRVDLRPRRPGARCCAGARRGGRRAAAVARRPPAARRRAAACAQVSPGRAAARRGARPFHGIRAAVRGARRGRHARRAVRCARRHGTGRSGGRLVGHRGRGCPRADDGARTRRCRPSRTGWPAPTASTRWPSAGCRPEPSSSACAASTRCGCSRWTRRRTASCSPGLRSGPRPELAVLADASSAATTRAVPGAAARAGARRAAGHPADACAGAT